jgi:hypothetical protein
VFAKKSRRGWSSPCGTHGGRRRNSARARRGGGRFYRRAQGGEGGCLARQGNQVMAWAAAWPEYGARGAATCGVYAGARLVGRRGAGTAALRPMDVRHVAPRKRAGMAVPRRMDQRAEAGLGVRPSEVAVRVARDTGATACAMDARAQTISTNPL